MVSYQPEWYKNLMNQHKLRTRTTECSVAQYFDAKILIFPGIYRKTRLNTTKRISFLQLD